MAYPSSSLPRITFRLDQKLLDRLQEAATANNRALNAEIVERLDTSLLHEAEGRAADIQALRRENYELRHAFVSVVETMMAKDKEGFREVVEGALASYRAIEHPPEKG